MNIISAVITILFQAMELAIVVRVLMSWLNISPYSAFARLLAQITDPILEPLRKHLPTVGMFDISPIAAILLLDVLRRLIVLALMSLR